MSPAHWVQILPGAKAAKVPKRSEATPAAVPVQPSPEKPPVPGIDPENLCCKMGVKV